MARTKKDQLEKLEKVAETLKRQKEEAAAEPKAKPAKRVRVKGPQPEEAPGTPKNPTTRGLRSPSAPAPADPGP